MSDILLYAVLTIIIGGLLYSVLGKDVGQNPERRPKKDPSQGKDANDVLDSFFGKPNSEKRPERPAPQEPSFIGPAAEGLGEIAAADANFSLPQFLDGAKGAYGMILEAFAAGDKDTLAALLTDDVKGRYFAAIEDLAEKGLTQTTDLARLIDAEVVSAEKSGKQATIRVAYFAELATALTDKDGKVVEGDLDMLSRVREVWSYERKLNDKNPNWKLSGVEPHTTNNPDTDNNTGGPDHSPDT
ncbi:MAG: Tim44/TimA family putative adaptor protein [Robiginitomaculum sp.]|nr:Tim44/TimA family putative adaptor protein [Robiginitomaculum sp.]